jgi:hypothetical protein
VKIEVRLSAFIVVDDKGNDFFAATQMSVTSSAASSHVTGATYERRPAGPDIELGRRRVHHPLDGPLPVGSKPAAHRRWHR